MRRALILGVLLFGGAVWGACGPPFPGVCDGNHCDCKNVPNCVQDCPAVGCQAGCHDVDNCDSQCGDACHWDCHNTSSCSAVCGDGCDAQCHDASACDIECGVDCKVDCHNLSSCSVVMISGEVDCHDSDCDIRCLQPDGGTVPADECGGNKYRCGC
jgi:hypothetical protein